MPFSLDDLGDVVIVSVAVGDTLRWDGSKFVNVPSSSLAIAGQDSTPRPPGTASVGVTAKAAVNDHVHPSVGLYAWWGLGSDGDVSLDGTNTYSFLTKSGNTYTPTRPLFIRDLTIAAGVTLKYTANILSVSGTLINAGTIHCDGGDASGATGGTGGGSSEFQAINPGRNGPNGGTGVGTAGTALQSTYQTLGGYSGAGGAGTSGAGGAGQSAGPRGDNNVASMLITANLAPWCFTGLIQPQGGSPMCGGAGGVSGGAGAGDGTNPGGGGGGGGGGLIINAKVFINSGTIRSNGGAGGSVSVGNCGGGGGGGSGWILINTTSSTNTGTVSVAPGAGGTKAGTGVNGSTGQSNGVAQINVWA